MSLLSQVGECYQNFILTKITAVAELNCTLREILHQPTGAQVMHIANDDPENLFCLSFQTLPSSSNGAAHILEHTVLCGSKKFPIKDPFFSMTRRSLNTFMNAFTGSDFTCYPAASQVEKDFYNLFEVYLDAVFHPQLKKMSFLQEGWRLEFSDRNDPKGPLEYKGVVFNEMKGSLSSLESRLWHSLLALLMPNLPYAYNSGGVPELIPTLSYEELIAFHKTFYHPSRCLFFFYGNLSLKKHLDVLETSTLSKIAAAPPLPHLPKQKRFAHPLHHQMRYPIHETDELSSKAAIAFGWLTTEVIDQEDALALSILDSALMDTDASPLKRALLASDLCIQAHGYLDLDMSEIPYAIVCKGCKEEDSEKLENYLRTSLKKIAEKGIPLELIHSALHQLEFSRTEIVGDHSPFGLTLFMRSALAKQHGCPPEFSLVIHSLFERLMQKAQDSSYFPNLMRKYFLDNPHFVRLTLLPDPQLAKEEQEEENRRLETIRLNLSEKERKKILEETRELEHYQKETQAQTLSCLPEIALSDIPILARDFSLKREEFGNLSVFHHEVFTNHIVYADLIVDLPKVAESDLPLVSLFTSFLTEVGAAGRDYLSNLEFMHAHTGGISAHCSLYTQVEDPHTFRPAITIRGKALDRNRDKLFSLLYDLTTKPRFDERDRLEELLCQLHSSLQHRLTRNALRYATQIALSGFSVPTFIANAWNGWSFFKSLESIVKHLDRELPSLQSKWIAMKDQLLCRGNAHLVLSCDRTTFEEIKRENFFGLCDLPLKEALSWEKMVVPPSVSSHAHSIPSPVAFTVEALKAPSYLHPHAAELSLATLLFENKILHPMIREKGGAYGSGAVYNAMLGTFHFHSYRDPQIASTLAVFEQALLEIAQGNFDDRDLKEAKIGMIQNLDAPISPGARAITAYHWWREGKTRAMRQHFRDQLLSTSIKEIAHAVEKNLLPKKQDSVVVSFASQELIERENRLLKEKGHALVVKED